MRTPPGAQRRLVDVELVRIDRALHHGLAQAVRGGDEHDIAEARVGVEREHDACGAQVAAHHVLHADRERHGVVVEVAVHAVGDRAIIEQRGIHLVHAREQMLFAAHVQEGFLLAGEGGLRQILRGCRGTHCDGEFGGLRPFCATPRAPLPGVWPEKGWRASSPESACRPRRASPHRRRRASRALRECAHRVRPAPENRDRHARWSQNPPAPIRPERARLEIISPIEAFLPPTSSTSLFFSFSNGMM